jgi:hypothetical protein
MSKIIEDTEDWIVYQTPFGVLRVFKRDVTRGDIKGKAGISIMTYDDPPPRKMRLKLKYLTG